MSYSFALADGDLVLRGDQLDLVFGVDKLRQDITCWLRERYGCDRFHVNYGSVLQDFIGGIVDENTEADVYGEILRVLQNYQAIQQRIMREDPTILSQSEMLVYIADVGVRVDYDTVAAQIKMINGSDQMTTMTTAATA